MKISPDVMHVLHLNELHINEKPTSYNEFEVYDCDGTLLFNITDRMPADGLNVMLRYADRRFKQGVADGRLSLRLQLLTALGAASSDHDHPKED